MRSTDPPTARPELRRTQRLKRVFIGAFVALAVALLGWQGDRVAEKALDLRFGAVLAKPRFPAPANPAEANLQDLEYLDRLTSVDRSFSAEAAAQFHRRVAAMKSRAAALTPPQFFLGVAEVVALADNAHTSVDPLAWREHLASTPVRLEWFDEGLHVVRALGPYASLLGKRVLAIDGIEPAQLGREATRYFGGPPERAHVSSPLVLESPQALHTMRPEAPDDRLVLRVADEGGPALEVELPAVLSREALGGSTPGRLLSPVPLAIEAGKDWRSAREAGQELPASLREPRKGAYAVRLNEGSVLYLHLWQIRDSEPGALEGFIRRALGPPGDAPWKRIILDLRFNGGGDYPTVYRGLKALAARLAPDGRLVILQDNTTFSAAIIAVALAKHFAGARATIVGDKPGDRLMFWAEGNDIRLPNSKIRVTTSTGYHDWAHGCRELRCYWPNFFYDVGVGRVDPDVIVRWRFEDYAKGVDTVLNRALQI